MLSAVASVVTTSAWARQALLDLYSLPAERVHVAEPGVEAAELAPGTATGDSLLSVAAVIPGKGHDVLLDALATLDGRRWHCLCVGSARARPGLRRGAAAPRRRPRDGRPRALLGAAARRGPLPQLRRSRSARASRRARRRTGWSSPRRSPEGCRSSPPTSAACRRRWDTAPTARGRACWSPRRRGCARRSAACLARGRRPAPSAAAGGARATRVALRTGRRPPPPWQTSSRGRRDDRRGDPRQPGLARPARARGRRGPLAGARRATPPPASWPTARWLIHDLACGSGFDGPVARAAPARAAALGPARPRRGPAGAARPSARPGRRRAGVTVETRLSDVTQLGRDELAGATLDHRLGAARPADGGRVGCGRSASAPARGAPCCSPSPSPVASNSLPPDPLDARVAAAFDAHQRRLTPRGRLLGPDAVEAAVGASAGWEPRSSSRPSPWQLGAAESDLAERVAHRLGRRRLRAGARAVLRRRSLPAPPAERGGGRSTLGHRRPRRPAGAAVRSLRRWAGLGGRGGRARGRGLANRHRPVQGRPRGRRRRGLCWQRWPSGS